MITFSTMQILICLGLGMGLGICGGLLGIGGGLIAIPVITYLFHMPQSLAQGTVLIMIIPNVLLSFIQYKKRNNIQLRNIIVLCAISSIVSFFAARYASHMNSDNLTSLFSGFLLIIGGYYFTQVSFKAKLPKFNLSPAFLPLLGVVSGIASGLFTVGGGLVVVPLLVALFSYSQTKAQGTALALVVPGAVSALVSYSLSGDVSWHIGIPLALGGVFSVSWGVYLAHKIPSNILKICFCSVIFFVAIFTWLI
ncbi:sulfite exporter TauE/SafE family protein [Affinibrenneria salicis]|uniref:Probable membrane transporter protein n=1 Tax=Affinibrenneria salicis TaxID=2590031 RepID=A0A5J5G3X3_9GAMM|nr:sulfite exporter TauE/SafE family protein [Affinibrenneria salicis]KAA9000733.1 sulfite exporter TauE/SafE family protein [Affinibrenneria salicis]